MDRILDPDIKHIEKRHYRINPCSNNYPLPKGSVQQFEESDANEVDNNEMDSELLEISKSIKVDDCGYTVSIRIPLMFHSRLIGRAHSKRKALEDEFRCKLLFQQNSSFIVVKSSSRFNVLSMCRRLLWIVGDMRARSKPTHFICLSANTESMQDAFNCFKKSVIELASSSSSDHVSGIDEAVFQDSCKLHFTVVTLVLADDYELKLAYQLLEKFCYSGEGHKLLVNGPMRLKLRGLDYMNDDPTSVHVLYAKVENSDEAVRFQTFSNALLKLYSDNNLLSSDFGQRPTSVKLHMTLMNSKFKAKKEDSTKRLPFNVNGIMNSMLDYNFGEHVLDSFYLSEISSLDPNTNFYRSYCKVTTNIQNNNVSVEMLDSV